MTAPPGTVLTTWGAVGVGDVVVPAPGAEWEVIEWCYNAGTVRVKVQRGDEASTSEVPALRPVYILDRVTAATERDGVDVAEVAAGVLTSGGLAPERYCPDCDHDTHRCPGCGDSVTHGEGACATCRREHGAPETVAPPGQTGAAILHSCQECGALTYPGRMAQHLGWHDTLESAL